MIKRLLSLTLVLVFALSMIPITALQTSAANNIQFEYGIHDYDRNTLKVTGYRGELKDGQDLIIPEKINGKTVTYVSGYYGNSQKKYGRFVLPKTVEELGELSIYGFTGEVEIPSSVKEIKRSDYMESTINLYGPKKLVYGASAQNPYGINYTIFGMDEDIFYSTVEEIVLKDPVEFFRLDNGFGEGDPLKAVYVSDSVKCIDPQLTAFRTRPIDYKYYNRFRNNDTVYYLKKFDTPKVLSYYYDDGEYDGSYTMKYKFGDVISERALAIGLENCKYSYTNKNEDLPVEQMFIEDAHDFVIFDEKSEEFGLYVGWSGTFDICVNPINTTDKSKINWTSSNPDVATVENGVVTAHDIGRTLITASKGGKSVSQYVYVRNIYIDSEDNGVSADNLSGNMDLQANRLNTNGSVELSLDASKLDPSDWTQWGQLQKALEKAFEQSLTCTEAFDISVKLKNNSSTWKVQPLEGRKISIWMPAEDLQTISKTHLIHVKEDGTYEELPFEAETVDGVLGVRFETSSFSSFLLIEEPNVAKIKTQPKSVTVASGKTAKVTLKASGEGLRYQWYYKDKGDSKFKLTTSFKGNTYTVSSMNASRDGRQVYCIVTDAYGNKVKSKTVTLSMEHYATITTQPKTAYAELGKKASVTVKATGDGLKYTWYVKDVGSTKYKKSSITSNTYSVKVTDKNSNRKLYCVITDKYGNSVKSNVVCIRQKLVITTQPKTAYVVSGKKASVTVKAKGDGLKYTWYVKNPGETKFSKSSIKSSTYSVKITKANSNRSVYCVVTDKYGKTVKTNTVYLRQKVAITTEPETGYAIYGEKAKVTVKATGDGLKYTWYVKDAGSSKYTKSSLKTNTYSVAMNEKTDGRRVKCVITDKYGKKVETESVLLKIKPTATSVSNVTSGKKSLTVSVKKQTKGTTGYQIQYSTSKNFTSYNTKSITKNTTTKATIAGLKSGKTYYVRVRTYFKVNGKTYYSNWSTVKSAKTK